jgi:NADPH-dependent glutamate synthase beta subunit-like oxidoreductase
VEGYINAIRNGNLQQAVAVLREYLPLPATIGRVCHHPCENACKLSRIDEPVAICELKRFVADLGLRSAASLAPIRRTRKERVAIIGSGPAGLAAAYDLVRKGYGVTVYEASPKAGGMLTAGIPEFILPREVVELEIDYIKGLGVDIKTSVRIGEQLSFDDLFKQGSSALLLATGAQKSSQLQIPGADVEGVLYALPLLQKIGMGGKVSFRGKVLVIGGGGVAMDAARTVKRLGANEVRIVCLESRTEMPAFPWEIHAAEEEGVEIRASLAPQRFTLDHASGSRKVVVAKFRKVASTQVDAEGNVSWTLVEGTDGECTMEADSIVVAIGQTPDPSCAESSQLKIGRRGTFLVDPDTLMTSVRGIFAAGDAVTGPKTVIEAVAAGKKAAIAIDRYLRGKLLKDRGMPMPRVVNADVLPQAMKVAPRRQGVAMPTHMRFRGFDEVNLGFTQKDAIEEAKRCLRCKTCNRCMEVYGCVAIAWGPNEKLGKISPQIDKDICIGCAVCPQLCPYNSIEPSQLR